MLNDFLNIIKDSKNNISSKRFSKTYFINHNLNSLWDWFESQKLNFPNYSNRDIITLLQHNLISSPTCVVCNNPAKVQYYPEITFNYCSNVCAKKSHIRSQKISQTKLSYTKEQNDEINKKRTNTLFNKTGYHYNSQRPEVKTLLSEKTSKRYLDDEIFNKLNDENWLYHEYITNKRTAVDIADELNVHYSSVLDYCRKYNFEIRKYSQESLPQKQIYNFLSQYYHNILYNDWTILQNLELDIYIPELKLAIEHNGLYLGHSFNAISNSTKMKHLNKTLRCKELGIELIHIRGDQWIKQQEIVKSMLLSKINKSTKIYARNCSIKEISHKEMMEFLDKNHIQGNINSKIKLGLYYENELVAVMNFGAPRFSKDYNWELLRFCNKLNYTVIGGFSKLLKYFRKNYPGSIISYCDFSRSSGNVYLKNGFSLLEKKLVPGYYYTNCHTVYNRMIFQKWKIKQLFESGQLKYYNENETEYENMFKNGYKIMFDCGQLVFILK